MTKEQHEIGFGEIVKLAEARRLVGAPSAAEVEAFLHKLPGIKSMHEDVLRMNRGGNSGRIFPA